MTELKKFLKKHNACSGGKDWALSTGATTCAEIWSRDDLRPDWRVWMAMRDGVLDHKTLVQFAVFCARQNWDLLKDDRSKNAILITEKWLKGETTLEDVDAASEAAFDADDPFAADYAAYAAYAAFAACASAAEAAFDADDSFAADYATAAYVYGSDAVAAAREPDTTAYAVAHASIRSTHAQWLIENVKPSWHVSQ